MEEVVTMLAFQDSSPHRAEQPQDCEWFQISSRPFQLEDPRT
jgi:hypothetical protein